MSGEEYLEVKFRLHDGTDIGPRRYLSATTVATLKESVLAQWPKGLKEKYDKAMRRNDVKAIVVTGMQLCRRDGNGNGSIFSGGFDINVLQEVQQTGNLSHLGRVSVDLMINTIEEAKKPSVAAIQGLALGGGLELAMVTESGRQERHAVATVGKFSVIWNFRQVKNNDHVCYKGQNGLKSCYCYKIVPKNVSIVDSKFMHDKFAITNSLKAPLVVATPKKVSSFSIAS